MLHFCRPETIEEDNLDRKLLASAQAFVVPFEGQVLKGYKWGEGKTVLLVHGWSSRASHMAFLGRNLVKAGFCVIAYDCPGHGNSIYNNENVRTNLPEYCRAIYHVTNKVGPLYAIIGHSFGAAAAVFTLVGQANLLGYKIDAKKLVMISSPSGIHQMVTHFCKRNGFCDATHRQMIALLEDEFPLKAKDYEISNALEKIDARVLAIHDKDDEEIDIKDARKMLADHKRVEFFETSGEGHRKILVSRGLLRVVMKFLKS